jgi:phosphoglucosamine mutase
MVSSPIRIEKLGHAPASANSSTRASVGASVSKSTPSIAIPAGWGGLDLPASRLFGTDGIRGKAGELLTAPLALQVGFWAGQVLRQNTSGLSPVILGQDSRNSSSMLAMALSAGLSAAGLEVWNLGLCPTPGVANLTCQSEAIGGIMISASHNPPEDNGIKFFDAQGSKLSLELQAQIEAALRGSATDLTWSVDRCGQHFYRPELVNDYLAAVQAPLLTCDRPLSGVKVVLDLAWGAAAQVAPVAFQALGAETICLHDRPDGDRINVNCGSTHLASLQAAVQEHGADLGFAFDGDADRVLAVDSHGRIVDGDYILYLWGQSLRQSDRLPGDTIVATVMSNLGFERAWEQQGGKLVRAAVGDQYVHAEMLRHGSMLGGEQSGHILCPHYGVSGDGLMTALHLTALAHQANGSLAALVDQSFQTYPQRLKNVRVLDRDRRLNWKACEPLQQAIAAAEADMGDRGRVLVRASGTEPLIRVMVEAATADLVNHWTEKLATIVECHLAIA